MILITGATGFVGTALRRQLEASSAPYRCFDGDVRDAEALRDQAAGCEALVHLAHRTVDPDGSGFAVNVDGTANAVHAARQVGARRVVLLSSAGVYGHAPHVDADESTPLSPDTPYSRSKAEAEALVLGAHDRGEVEAVVLRPRFVIGPGDRSVVGRIHRVAARSPVWVAGGRAWLSLVGVDDLGRVLSRATSEALPDGPPVFHVTDGEPVRFRTLATELCALLGGAPPRLSVPLWLLYLPVRARELALGIDPETSAASISSIRLRLAATDQSFSNARLAAWMPDLRFTPRSEVLRAAKEWYSTSGSGA